METMSVDGLSLFFDADERDAAELIGQACERSVHLIHESWGLDTPQDCHVYVMTSWLRFVFHSAPWHWRVLLAASMPLWVLRVRKLEQSAGGWAQAYGKRRVVGVKPPRLIRLGDRSMGDRVFVKVGDVREKVQHNTCHELVHAFAAHLKLPAWLNEGLAMVTVDRYVGRPTVRYETLEALERRLQETGVESKREMRVGDEGWVVYHYVRGYWLTRYIEETRPELLKDLLSGRHGHRELEGKIAVAYAMEPKEFWGDIDRVLISYWTAPTGT